MKIGFDVDGVLASFEDGLERVVIELTGKNLFPPMGKGGPPVWDWPTHYGYTLEETQEAFANLRNDPEFWVNLPELPGAVDLRNRAESLLNHDIYFITDRVGIKAKQQTEDWLLLHTGAFNPTVLITPDKALCCRALKLDCYLDDRPRNIQEVAETSTRSYRLVRNYNADATYPMEVRHVHSVSEFLEREGI